MGRRLTQKTQILSLKYRKICVNLRNLRPRILFPVSSWIFYLEFGGYGYVGAKRPLLIPNQL